MAFAYPWDTESWFTYGPTIGNAVSNADLANMALRSWTLNAPAISPTWAAGKYPGGIGLQYNAQTQTDLAKANVFGLGVGGWFNIPAGYGAMWLISMVDQNTPPSSYCYAGIDASGNVQANYSGTVHPSSPVTNVTDGLWHHWELNIGQSSFILWIDGMSVWSIAFINSDMRSSSIGGAGGCPVTVSDLFFAQQTGGGFPGGIGPARVECLMPAANGSYNGIWTPSSGSDAHAMVNDRPEDGINSFIWSANNGDRASFTNTGLASTSGTVAGVVVGMIADRTTGTPTRTAEVFFKNGDGVSSLGGQTWPAAAPGTLLLGSNTTMNPSYLWMPSENSSPGTFGAAGGAWSIAKVNATEIGVQVTQ